VRGPTPSRGDVWLINLNPTRGHEQAGVRPGLVVSTNLFNSGPAELVVVVPLTRVRRGIPLHVAIGPPEGGVREPSFAKCEDVRSVAKERLIERWGNASQRTMAMVEDRLRILLEL
jgi:mRNA interferase MazF